MSSIGPTTPGVATVLAPPAGSDARVMWRSDWDRSGLADGAVVSPDGIVFSIGVDPHPSWLPDRPEWETIPADQRAVETVAGREVAAFVDGTSPTQIYRTVRDDCWSISIDSADTPMWSDNVTALIGAITTNGDVDTADEAAVEIAVPDGWTSLGGGRMDRSWTMSLRVDVDGANHDVHLVQVPNAPVGLLLSGESNPVPFDHDGRQWWAVDIVTTPGITSVVGDAGLGVFHITSDLPAARLVEIVDALTPTAVDQLDDVPRVPSDTVVPEEAATEIGTVASGAAECGDLGTGLELIEP